MDEILRFVGIDVSKDAVESWTDTDVQLSTESLGARQPPKQCGAKKQEMIAGFCFKFYS